MKHYQDLIILTLKVGLWADSWGAGHKLWVRAKDPGVESKMGVMTPNCDE